MHPAYQDALLTRALDEVAKAPERQGFDAKNIVRRGTTFFVPFHTQTPSDRFVARIDAEQFPVEPYEVGFIKPAALTAEWMRISSRDPRYWPWSPVPGLDGSFHVAYGRPIRVFWCRDCTASYFYYHGAEPGQRWDPARWPLATLIDELITAAFIAKHPRTWRPPHRIGLLNAAQAMRIELPTDAGIDDN